MGVVISLCIRSLPNLTWILVTLFPITNYERVRMLPACHHFFRKGGMMVEVKKTVRFVAERGLRLEAHP
jgi:hypothetical protein